LDLAGEHPKRGAVRVVGHWRPSGTSNAASVQAVSLTGDHGLSRIARRMSRLFQAIVVRPIETSRPLRTSITRPAGRFAIRAGGSTGTFRVVVDTTVPSASWVSTTSSRSPDNVDHAARSVGALVPP